MKKTKLLTSLAALALVLSLGACEVNVDVGGVDMGGVDVGVDVNPNDSSEPDEGGTTDTDTNPGTGEGGEGGDTGDEGGDTGTGSGGDENPNPGTGEGGGSTETTTLSNYTLSIGITYNSELEAVPEYANAYITGGWDSWTEWLPLTASEEGRYEYTFSSIEVGTYEFQLVLDYDDTNIGYTYRVTSSNASFTVKEEDGDDYKNEVTVTSSKALSEIIPDPNAALSNVTVTFDITYGGASQGILEYADLWIEGSWNWSEGLVKCDVVDNKYTYTFESLAPIDYQFLGVIYYNDEQLPSDDTLWDYKVNGNDCTFTVSGVNVVAELVATKALAEILPIKSEATPEEDEDIELASEIIESILDNDVDWNAYHGEVEEDDEYNVVDFALDENSNTYGRRLSYEDEELYEEVFYQDGTAYWYDPEEDDPDDAYYTSTTVPSISSYLNSNLTDALDEAEDIDFDDDDYTLDTLEYLADGGYKVVVGYSYTNYNGQTVTGTFTYVVDSSYRLTELGYEYSAVYGTTTEYAKEITLDDVKEIMDSEFDISLWLEDEEEAEETKTLSYYYAFASGNGVSTSGGTVTLGGLKWTTTSAVYVGGEYSGNSRGLQIGSSNSAQTTPWTISTDFGEDVTLTSVAINVVGASSSSGANFTITHGDTKVADSVSFSTTAKDYEYTNLSVSGSTLSISMVCTAKAMYLKYISFTIEVAADSSLSW